MPELKQKQGVKVELSVNEGMVDAPVTLTSSWLTLIPQLPYSTDHPGSAIPGVWLAFEVTN